MDYVTKWMEAKALLATTSKAVGNFLHGEIFIRFEVPWKIFTNGGTWITSICIEEIMETYKIEHKLMITYHLEANGRVEGKNKIK